MIALIKQFFAPRAAAAGPLTVVHGKALQTASKVKIDGPLDDSKLPEQPEQEAMPMLRHTKLIMVTAENNNKFYEMQENADGTFTATYGRVGGHGSTASYPIAKWDSKRQEKLRKGYRDQTHLFTEGSSASDFADIPDPEVRGLIEDLVKFSRQSILRNYNVAADQVTRQQLELAQAVLDRLAQQVRLRMHLQKFNNDLLELYQVIPRRMKKVAEHLVERPKTPDDIRAIETKLAEEQAILDVMRGEVEALEQQSQTGEKLTLPQILGIQVEPLHDTELIRHIKEMMGPDSGKFRRAFKVANTRTQAAFDHHLATAKNQRTELFWHGSRNENWLSILKAGLVLRPANAIISGKMFGYGLYFADKFRKSLNYSSLRGSFWSGGNAPKGYLALYDVHLGHPLQIKNHRGWCSQLTGEGLKKRGSKYDSVFAQGGADLLNNEYIVYHEAQCTVRYLVEVHA